MNRLERACATFAAGWLVSASASAQAVPIEFAPNPISFANVSSAWSVLAEGSWNGASAAFDFNFSGQFAAVPVLWGVSFDGLLATPAAFQANFGTWSGGAVPGTMQFNNTAGGRASYALPYLPASVTFAFDNGFESAAASSSVSAEDVPPPPPPPPPGPVVPLALVPSPITFAGVSGLWSASGTGAWNGTAASFSFDLTGVAAGFPTAWSIVFDDQPVPPAFVSQPPLGDVLEGASPGVFGWTDTASGQVAFTLGFLPSSVAVGFDNGVESALAIAAVQVVPEPQTYALLLAGLALLIFAARSRTVRGR